MPSFGHIHCRESPKISLSLWCTWWALITRTGLCLLSTLCWLRYSLLPHRPKKAEDTHVKPWAKQNVFLLVQIHCSEKWLMWSSPTHLVCFSFDCQTICYSAHTAHPTNLSPSAGQLAQLSCILVSFLCLQNSLFLSDPLLFFPAAAVSSEAQFSWASRLSLHFPSPCVTRGTKDH